MIDPTIGFDNDILDLDGNNLRDEWATFSRGYKEWLDAKVVADDQKRRAKVQLNRTRKAVELSLRMQPSPGPQAKIDAEIEEHPAVVALGEELLDLELISDRASAVVEAMRAKKSMLMILGGITREEMATDKFSS